MPRTIKSRAPKFSENPLVPNALLCELGSTMQALRADRRTNRRGQEAIHASILLTLREGDFLSDLSGSEVGREPHLRSAPFWIEPPAAQAGTSMTLLLGAALALQIQTTARPARTGEETTNPVLLLLLEAVSLTRAQWSASLRTAAQHSLPLLLVTLPAPHMARARSDFSQALGVPGIPVDAVDAVALCRVLSESVLRARNGDGPTLIETIQWRLEDRPEDPLRRHAKLLRTRGLSSHSSKRV